MQRLLVVGFGDIARRAAPLLERRFELTRLARRFGADLDRPVTLHLKPADTLLYCAPPPGLGDRDTRVANLLKALDRTPERVVYLSTSGVYGDCGGELVDESRSINPQTARARRRADAESRLQEWCAGRGTALVILRVPGIYARDRLPLERLRQRVAVLRAEDDVYTSHIHADDLAAIAARSLESDALPGVYNAADDTQLLMGDWLDLVADDAGLARPPRLARQELEALLPDERASFMRESRRLDNRRLKAVLGVRLRYPTVHQGLAHEHAISTY